jgi:hypothetical protein
MSNKEEHLTFNHLQGQFDTCLSRYFPSLRSIIHLWSIPVIYVTDDVFLTHLILEFNYRPLFLLKF